MDEHIKQSNQEMSSKPTQIITRAELEKEISQLLSRYPIEWNPCWGWTCVGSLCTIHLGWVCKNDFCSINDDECGDISIMLEVSALEADVDSEFCRELKSEIESIRVSQEAGRSDKVDCAHLEEIWSRRYERDILDGWVFAMHGATNRVAEPTRMGWSIIENVFPREQCSFSLSDNTGKVEVLTTNGWSETPEIENMLVGQDEILEQDIAWSNTENSFAILLTELIKSEPKYDIGSFKVSYERELFRLKPAIGLVSLALGDGPGNLHRYRIVGLPLAPVVELKGSDLCISSDEDLSVDEGRIFFVSSNQQLLFPTHSDPTRQVFSLSDVKSGELCITSEARIVSMIENRIRKDTQDASQWISLLTVISAEWGLECAVSAAQSDRQPVREEALRVLVKYGKEQGSRNPGKGIPRPLRELGQRTGNSASEQELMKQLRLVWQINLE